MEAPINFDSSKAAAALSAAAKAAAGRFETPGWGKPWRKARIGCKQLPASGPPAKKALVGGKAAGRYCIGLKDCAASDS